MQFTATVEKSFWGKAKGWLGRRQAAPGEGLLLEGCASIHTFGMRFSLDVLFLDRSFRVLKTVRNLKPWRAAACSGAWGVLELPAGTVSGSLEGRRLSILERA